MQIKTGLTLAAGIGIGIFVGMTVTDDTKDRVFSGIRKKLIKALGAEEKRQYTTQPRPKTYASYFCRNAEEGWKSLCTEALHFDDNEEAANAWLKEMKKEANELGTVSVHDILRSRGFVCDWTWDKYGWTAYQLEKNAFVDQGYFNGKPYYDVIITVSPHYLDRRDKQTN